MEDDVQQPLSLDTDALVVAAVAYVSEITQGGTAHVSPEELSNAVFAEMTALSSEARRPEMIPSLPETLKQPKPV